MSRECPHYLSVDSLRDYVIALPRRSEWIFLGRVQAPRRMVMHVKAPCDLYALPFGEKVDDPIDVPTEIAELNQRFFTTIHTGLTGRQVAWQIMPLENMAYPQLWRYRVRDFYQHFMNRRAAGSNLTLGAFWWEHPARRAYDRLILIPRENEPE
ncbi:MAG: hypothetical protein ABFE13_17720 [Phycisphaerales bacterium]